MYIFTLLKQVKSETSYGRILFDVIHFPKIVRVWIVTLSCRNHSRISLKTS